LAASALSDRLNTSFSSRSTSGGSVAAAVGFCSKYASTIAIFGTLAP